MATVDERLRPCKLEQTLQYDPYQDEMQNKKTSPQLAEKLEPKPEVGNQFIGTEILLPRWDKMASSNIVTWNWNANGNAMGRAHAHPLIDTRLYQVELAGSKVTELTTNIIAESMYAQHDANGNEYLLLDVLIDYHRDNNAISLTD